VRADARCPLGFPVQAVGQTELQQASSPNLGFLGVRIPHPAGDLAGLNAVSRFLKKWHLMR
jgi:hypothetical protein